MRGTWEGSGTWKTSGPDGGLVLAVIAAAVVIGSGAAAAIASALVTLIVVAAVVMVLAVLGMIGLVVYRVRQDRPRRAITPPAVYQVPRAAQQRLEAPQPLAIEPPREVHLHITVSPEQLAAILRHSANEQ